VSEEIYNFYVSVVNQYSETSWSFIFILQNKGITEQKRFTENSFRSCPPPCWGKPNMDTGGESSGLAIFCPTHRKGVVARIG
jgi:hypothetical protein